MVSTRRSFLQSLLGGLAALTVTQRAAVDRELAELPPAPEPVPGEEGAFSLNWRPPVASRALLPADAEEADAVYLEDEVGAVVYVRGVGWLSLSPVVG